MISSTTDPARRVFRTGLTKDTTVIKYIENMDFRGLV